MNKHSTHKRSGQILLATMFVKSLSAFFVGIVAALVGRVFIGYGSFGFIFVGVTFAGLFLTAFSKSSFLKVIIFDAAFVFFLLLLDMYVNIAPTL